jgi:hypothetical protein
MSVEVIEVDMPPMAYWEYDGSNSNDLRRLKRITPMTLVAEHDNVEVLIRRQHEFERMLKQSLLDNNPITNPIIMWRMRPELQKEVKGSRWRIYMRLAVPSCSDNDVRFIFQEMFNLTCQAGDNAVN